MAAEPLHQTGFTARLDPDMARRQLRMSAGVAAVLGVAIAATIFAVRPDNAGRPAAPIQDARTAAVVSLLVTGS